MSKSIPNKSFLILILFCFSIGCKNKEQKINVTFLNDFEPQKNVLISRSVPQIRQKNPKMIGLVGDTLMVIDNDQEPYLNFYDLNGLNFLGSYGSQGHGPNQFINPKYANQFFYKNHHLNFVVADAQKFTLSVLDLNKILKNSNSYPEHVYRIPAKLILNYVSMFITPDSTLIGNYRGTKNNYGRFFSYDIKNDIINWIDYFPKPDINVPSRTLPFYYYSSVSYNPQQNLMVSAMLNFKQIDFINTVDFTIQSKVFASSKDHYPSLDANMNVAKSNKIFYIASFSTKDFIYATCANQENGQYLKMNNKSALELHVFNWKGEKVKMMMLDRTKLGSFVVDEKRRKIYALNFGEDKDKIPVVQYNY